MEKTLFKPLDSLQEDRTPAFVEGDVLSYMNRPRADTETEADLLKSEFKIGGNAKRGGMINFEELELLLEEGGETHPDVAKQLYECMVKDRHGRISFDDFVDFIFSERSQTSQARFGCQTRASRKTEKIGFEPFSFPLPWNELDHGSDEDDEPASPVRCTFEEFYAWLTCSKQLAGGKTKGSDVKFATAESLVSELKNKYSGDRDAAMNFFEENHATIDLGVRPVTGASYLASRKTLRELQRCVCLIPGQADWIRQAHTQGLQCGELLQEALVTKLIAKGSAQGLSMRITPRLVQSLHQVVSCGWRLSCFREDACEQRIIQLGVQRHRLPPAAALPTLVVLYCQQTELALKKWEVHEVAAFALWWVSHLQPFSEGNGRTARGLALAVLRLRGHVPKERSFHQLFREQKVYKRLAACLGEANAATGACTCCGQGESVGVKPKAFASLSALLREFV